LVTDLIVCFVTGDFGTFELPATSVQLSAREYLFLSFLWPLRRIANEELRIQKSSFFILHSTFFIKDGAGPKSASDLMPAP
jgi:hypothetical protein